MARTASLAVTPFPSLFTLESTIEYARVGHTIIEISLIVKTNVTYGQANDCEARRAAIGTQSD